MSEQHEVFIRVDVSTEHSADPALAKKLEEACPVDIFKATDGGVTVVTENDSRLPIVAFMAGRFMDEMPGMSFGHAGTIVEGKEDTATEKIARLGAAGITIAERIEDIPDLVLARLKGRR